MGPPTVTANLTAKTKYFTATLTKNHTAKPNTSQQKQNGFGFAMGICFCRAVFGFALTVVGHRSTEIYP